MHWPRIHLPPGVHRNQRIVRPMLPPGVVGQWRGENIVVDGDMEIADTSAWLVGNGAALTKEITDPAEGARYLRVTRTTANNPYARQSVLTPGVDYYATGWARSDGNCTARFSDSGLATWITTSSEWEKIDVLFTAFGTNVRLYALTSTPDEYAEFDDIYVSEV